MNAASAISTITRVKSYFKIVQYFFFDFFGIFLLFLWMRCHGASKYHTMKPQKRTGLLENQQKREFHLRTLDQ